MTRYREVNLDRKWMKNHKIGSDAFIQLSFQFAAATHYGHHVNQYEVRISKLLDTRVRLEKLDGSVILFKAGSMAMFYRGRTETVRPLTKEAVEAYKHLRIAEENPSEENLLSFA